MFGPVSPVTIVALVSALVGVVIGVETLRKRPDPMAWPLAALMFAVAAWAVPHAISFECRTLECVAFWHRVRYPGTVTAPVLYLVVALRYAGHEEWLSRRTCALLGVVPTITVVAVWTNSAHGLFWESIAVATVEGASVLHAEFGAWYWVNLGYLYLTTVVGLLVLAAVVLRSGPVYRKQAALIFVGGLVPLITNGMLNFASGPGPTIDFTTTAMAVSGLTFALALFHFDLLEVRPVARARLVEELDDGVVVVGPNGRIRDYNRTASRVLEGLQRELPADEVFQSGVALDGGDMIVDNDDRRRRFRVRSTPLSDGGDRKAGRIVYLNDVTELVEREQRISVLNRVLRHNVRNELNVASGHLSILADRVSGPDRDHVRTARESTRRVVEFAEKARDIERTARRGADARVVVSSVSVAERVVADARERFPDATVEIDRAIDSDDPSGRVRVASERLFETALAELVENAVIHNDHDRPRATLRVERDGERLLVSVADNGPDIPEQEIAALRSLTETSLEHGSGLGLWLVTWIASLSAGDLGFADDGSRGNVVTLSLPAAGE